MEVSGESDTGYLISTKNTYQIGDWVSSQNCSGWYNTGNGTIPVIAQRD
jgi:hypothetical protein